MMATLPPGAPNPQRSLTDETVTGDDSVWTTPVIIRSVALSGLFIMALFYTLHTAASLLIPMTLAFLLSLLLSPVVRWLARLHIPEPIGAAIVLLALLGFLATSIYLLSGPAAHWVDQTPQVLQQIETKLQLVQKPMEDFKRATREVEKLTQLGSEAAPNTVVAVQQPRLPELLLSGTPTLLAGLGVIVILLYFLLAAGDMFLRKLVTVIPNWQDKKRAVEIVRSIEEDISSYLFTITLINLGLGAAVAVAMFLLGVPNPLLWGAMVAALNFAPYIGALASVVILSLVGIISFDSLSHALAVPAVLFILTLLEGQLITPMIVGHRLALNPVVVFLGMLIWGWLWGIAGTLLAVPLLVSFRIVFERVDRLASVAVFLGSAEEK